MGKFSHFLALSINISKTVADRAKVSINTLTARSHGVDTSLIAKAYGVDIEIYEIDTNVPCITPWGEQNVCPMGLTV